MSHSEAKNESVEVIGREEIELPTGIEPLSFDIRTESVTASHLNNFFCNLPGGFYRSLEVLGAAFEPGESFLDAFRRFQNSNRHTLGEGVLDGYSEKKLHQTPFEFFAAVDAALQQCRVERGIVIDLIERIADPNTNGRRPKLLQELNVKVLPAYFALRAQGYSHRDLVG